MIFKHPYGVSPSLSVTIDGASVAYDTIKEVEVMLEENLHDMAVLHLIGLPTRATLDYRNRPVQITLDTGATYFQEFNGYVVDILPESLTKDGTANKSPFQNSRLVCLGASYAMRGTTSHVWADHRLQDVVDTFSDKYGFSYSVPSDPLVFSPMIQDNESDWQFVVRYATMMGYKVTMHGTHLHVFDPFKAAGRGISYNKLRTASDLGGTIAPHPGNIVSFSASLKNDHPDGVYKDTVVSVHDDLNNVYDVSLRDLRGLSSPALFPDRLASQVDSYEQAVRSIEARARSTYDFAATAEVLGVAGCKPGGVINLDQYGGEVDGLWYVNSIRHVLNSAMFTSELSLSKNIVSELLNPTPVAKLPPPPTANLVNGKWSTSRRVSDVYS